MVADSDKNLFSDVRPGDWFYQVVYTAKTEGWMNGYADTIIFGAGNSITRGEVACVLFNMADADGKLDYAEGTELRMNVGYYNSDQTKLRLIKKVL